MTEDRLSVSYRLTCAAGENPEAKARDVAFEQTVELPAAAVPEEIRRRVAGRVESVEPGDDGRCRAEITYDPAIFGNELGLVLNLLFGNVSMKAGVRIERVDWPEAIFEGLAGPRFGIAGLREICEAEERPLVCAALKPLGLSVDGLASRCRELALAGVDLVKDDHSLADQPWAPFEERVGRLQEVVAEANRETGGRTVYLPNLPGDAELPRRLETVLQAGCYGALVSPLVLGLGTVVSLAEEAGLLLLGHPALAGAFFAADHGIAPQVLLGELFRMSGCDGVIYPNVGGRFLLSESDCDAVHAALRRRMAHLLPSFPIPGGGVDPDRIPEWIDRFGIDTVFLVGAGLYRDESLRDAAERLVASVRG